MFLESLLLATVLFGLAHVQRAWFAPAPHASIGSSTHVLSADLFSRLIGYCGAGIYEELLFRLMLLPSIAAALKKSGLTCRASWLGGILATSLVFAAAHYQWLVPGGYTFDWYSFSFRLVAGVFFAVVFVTRGFGIAAGAHAFYNMLVEVVRC
jgi:membrane protease YdiL (CAAX protease family)